MSKIQLSIKIDEINLNDFIEPVIAELALVEQQLNTNLIDDNLFINELLSMVFKAGGKRIRPLLVLHSARATNLSEEVNDLQIILAVLSELIHSASLVHDDILDSAVVRRGSQTINKRFSDRLAVLLGDLLFAQASICLAKIKSPVIVGIYGQVLGDLCAGEIQQMKQQFSTTISWQDYIKKSISKTGSLFAAGTHSAAILNKANNETVMALKNYGLHLGLCFQIVDDLLDFTGDSTILGKEAGSDLKSGIITAPTLFVLEQKNKASEELKELISSKQISEPESLQIALDLIKNNGGIESTIDLAKEYGQKAKDNLKDLPNSIYRDSLVGFTDYVLNRVN
jgi:all-trans-nonaprenyl-diphosphate synthase